MSVKTFKKAQVEEHNKRNDLWIILHDKVYDVTKFLNEHPGGDEVLEEAAGKDATKDFDDVGHSDEAIEQLKNYYLGDIIDEEKKEKKKPSKKENTQNKQTKYCIAGISILAIAIGAILIYKGCRMCK